MSSRGRAFEGEVGPGETRCRRLFPESGVQARHVGLGLDRGVSRAALSRPGYGDSVFRPRTFAQMDPHVAAQLIELARTASPSDRQMAEFRRSLGRLDPAIRVAVRTALAGEGRAVLRARATMEDLEQDVLERMSRRVGLPANDEGRPPVSVLLRWIRVVANNVLVSQGRRSWTSREQLEATDDADVGGRGPTRDLDPVETGDLVRVVARCVERLSEQRARLWRLMASDPDITVGEIAVALGYVAADGVLSDEIRDRIYALRSAMRRDMVECVDRHEVRAEPAPSRPSRSVGGSP